MYIALKIIFRHNDRNFYLFKFDYDVKLVLCIENNVGDTLLVHYVGLAAFLLNNKQLRNWLMVQT